MKELGKCARGLNDAGRKNVATETSTPLASAEATWIGLRSRPLASLSGQVNGHQLQSRVMDIDVDEVLKVCRVMW